jgi:hypothetical protein
VFIDIVPPMMAQPIMPNPPPFQPPPTQFQPPMKPPTQFTPQPIPPHFITQAFGDVQLAEQQKELLQQVITRKIYS